MSMSEDLTVLIVSVFMCLTVHAHLKLQKNTLSDPRAFIL